MADKYNEERSALQGIFTDDTLDKIAQQFGFFSRQNTPIFDKYTQYGFHNVHNAITGLREYLFFTKPHLNLSGIGGKNARYAQYVKQCYGKVYNALSSGGKGFIPLLTNMSVMTPNGVDVPNHRTMEFDTMSTIYGATISYMGHSLESTYGNEFTVEFYDTRYLDVYMLFHLWDRYSTLKSLGYVKPHDAFMPPNNILDDQISIYKIIVGEDGETIIYFCKYTGCYPQNIERSVFSTLEPGVLKIPITFKSFKFEDGDPTILDEFNEICNSKPTFKNPKISNEHDFSWKSGVHIEEATKHGRPVYKLKWDGGAK